MTSPPQRTVNNVSGNYTPRPLDDLEGAPPARALRRPRGERRRYRRYEWSRAGALLHMEVTGLARFAEPGHRATGNRRRRSRRVGYDYLHCFVDDNSRIAHVELHPREDAETNARTLERALAEQAARARAAGGGDDRQCLRLHVVAPLPGDPGRRRPAPRHPALHAALDGKVEAFINTLQQAAHRSAALPTSMGSSPSPRPSQPRPRSSKPP